MKLKLLVLCLCLSFAATAMAKTTELPDSCGDPNTKFEVTAHKSTTALPAPDAGKGMIVFIQPARLLACIGCSAQKYAMDGQWVGATQKDTYFTVQVDPGQHHFCSTGPFPYEIAIRTFEVKAGSTYFLQARAITAREPQTEEEHDSQVIPAGKRTFPYGLSLLDEEKARYQLKSYEVAEFKKK